MSGTGEPQRKRRRKAGPTVEPVRFQLSDTRYDIELDLIEKNYLSKMKRKILKKLSLVMTNV